MDAEEVRSSSEREFRRMKLCADRALEQIDDGQFFQAIDPESNSPGLLVKHMAGNLSSLWRNFLTEDGEKSNRDRDGEFVMRPEDTRNVLMSAWEEGWATLFEAVSALTQEQMTEGTAVICGEQHTVTEALHRQMSHYGYHVGQIVFLAKHLAGEAWQSLSIPRGQSRAFNEKSLSYLRTQTADTPDSGEIPFHE
jgi:hypothetical protein